jgi:phage tail-like protein
LSAFRWLAHGDWVAAQHLGTAVQGGALVLAAGPGASGGSLRHGVALLRAGRPDPAQVDSTTADRWRRVVLRLADPPPPECWLRLWTLVATTATVPGPPRPGVDDDDRAAVPTPADRWRAAALGAIDARVLCHEHGELWVALELGGAGAGTPRVADLRVESGDDGPVTDLPVAYRATRADPAANSPGRPEDGTVDGGDGVLGRYLGLLGAELRQTSSLIGELPTLLNPAVAPDRADAPWIERLAAWVALDTALLPSADAGRRETVASAAVRHAWRGTRRGLLDQVWRETGLSVQVVEPLALASVWRLDAQTATSALGLTTGLVSADPGPPVLDRTTWLDASMLIQTDDAGLPVHAHLAHRICVHVPGGSAAQVAAVDVVVQRERPAHVLARTCAIRAHTRIPVEVEVDHLPGRGPAGLANDTAYDVRIDGPGLRLGAARLPAPDPEPDPSAALKGDLR